MVAPRTCPFCKAIEFRHEERQPLQKRSSGQIKRAKEKMHASTVLSMLVILLSAYLPEQRHGEHGLAQLGEKHVQAPEILLRKRAIQMIRYSGDKHVQLARIHRKTTSLYCMRALRPIDYIGPLCRSGSCLVSHFPKTLYILLYVSNRPHVTV